MLVRLGMKRSEGERPGAGDPLDRRGDRVGVRTRGGAGRRQIPIVCSASRRGSAASASSCRCAPGYGRVGAGAPPNELILLFWCSCGYCAGAVLPAQACRAGAWCGVEPAWSA